MTAPTPAEFLAAPPEQEPEDCCPDAEPGMGCAACGAPVEWAHEAEVDPLGSIATSLETIAAASSVSAYLDSEARRLREERGHAA